MHCFYHADVEAVGLCKHCSRGLCSACATEMEDALACKDRHERKVEALVTIMAGNAAIYGRVGPVQYIQSAAFVLVTLGLLGSGGWWLFVGGDSSGLGIVFVLLGALFGVGAFMNIRWLLARRKAGEAAAP